MKRILVIVCMLSVNVLSAQGYFGALGNQVFFIINGTTYQAGNTITLMGNGPFVLQDVYVKTEKWVRGGGTSNACGGTLNWSADGGASGMSSLSFHQNLSPQGNNDIQEWRASPNANLNIQGGTNGIDLVFNLTGSESSFSSCAMAKQFSFGANTVLPVKFKYISASVVGQAVKIDWTVEAEEEHDRYEIMRSTDAKNWKTIHTLSSLEQRSDKKTYSYLDEQPVNGKSYYQVVQVDLQNKMTASMIATVDHLLPASTIVFPTNVDENGLTVAINSLQNQQGSITIYSPIGNVLYQTSIELKKGHNSFALESNDLPKGLNYVRINVDNQRSNQRIHKIIKL